MPVSNAVLITGCSTGIGRATAQHLTAKGWAVYATARSVELIQDLEGHGCKVLALDVTDEESMRSVVRAIEKAEGAVGVLVNNAGYSQSGPIEQIPLDQVRRQFETNVFGVIRMSQLVLPEMRRQGFGRIVNLSSMGGKLTFPGGGAYHATKHAVEAISDALRFEVRGFGVDVVVIEPGLIKTRFAETAVASMRTIEQEGPYADFDRAVAQATAGTYESSLGRLGGGPDAVARVIDKAISRRRPKPRYPVTPSAHLLMRLRKILPDRSWDAFLKSSFPQPGVNGQAEWGSEHRSAPGSRPSRRGK